MCFRRFKKTGKRNEIFLATKFGITETSANGTGVNGTPEYVRSAAEKSLHKAPGNRDNRLVLSACKLVIFVHFSLQT